MRILDVSRTMKLLLAEFLSTKKTFGFRGAQGLRILDVLKNQKNGDNNEGS